MFYLTYLRQELRRRLGRTLLTVCGLGVGVALVLNVTGLSAGLQRAQTQVLGPLAGVGTDMTVTKSLGGGNFGLSAPVGGTLGTDLSKLGKPGERFSTDTLFSAQWPFSADEAAKIGRIEGIEAASKVLRLRGIHQEGTVPKAATTPKETSGAQPQPITAEQWRQLEACLSKSAGSSQPADPNADAFERAFQGDGGHCLSALTPGRAPTTEGQRGVDITMPGTDIRSGQFTLAGIEPKAHIGVVSGDEVTAGRFLARGGEAMVSEAYAAGKKLKPGSTLELKGRSFKVVGVTTSPLVGEPNDIYLPLSDLQALSGHKDESSTILVRASSASKVDDVSASIRRDVPGANVSDASALAERVEGSLVDSQSLIRGLALVLGIIGMIAAVLIAALLTLSSVAKRSREVGTLRAIGWGPGLIVRQIVVESAAQGVLGALFGIALGFGGAALLGVFGPTLAARAVPSGGLSGLFGLGSLGEQASEAVKLSAPIRPSMVFLAAALAVAGGLVAGGVGAMRAARMGPADAMRGVS